MDDADPQPSRAKPPQSPREARLAKALRDNLRRRKQARAPAAPAETDPPDPLAND
jgi:hypothetical protein